MTEALLDDLRAGISRSIRFHDLRHTFATMAAREGAPIRMLMAWMGHADMKTTLIYAHHSPDVVNEKAIRRSRRRPQTRCWCRANCPARQRPMVVLGRLSE